MPIPPSHHSLRLAQCADLSSVLELVAEGVREVLGVERRDVSVRVEELPERIAAVYVIGYDAILINSKIVSKVESELSFDRGLSNSYIYFILLHEYIHALGVVDEERVYRLARRVCREELGRYHPATLLSEKSPPVPSPRAFKELVRSLLV